MIIFDLMIVYLYLFSLTLVYFLQKEIVSHWNDCEQNVGTDTYTFTDTKWYHFNRISFLCYLKTDTQNLHRGFYGKWWNAVNWLCQSFDIIFYSPLTFTTFGHIFFGFSENYFFGSNFFFPPAFPSLPLTLWSFPITFSSFFLAIHLIFWWKSFLPELFRTSTKICFDGWK